MFFWRELQGFVFCDLLRLEVNFFFFFVSQHNAIHTTAVKSKYSWKMDVDKKKLKIYLRGVMNFENIMEKIELKFVLFLNMNKGEKKQFFHSTNIFHNHITENNKYKIEISIDFGEIRK